MSAVNHGAILSILDQLLKCTEQLSECHREKELDISALSIACGNGLKALQNMLSEGLAAVLSTDKNGFQAKEGCEILEAFKALEGKTKASISILREVMNRTEDEMAALRGKRKAIRAYGLLNK